MKTFSALLAVARCGSLSCFIRHKKRCICLTKFVSFFSAALFSLSTNLRILYIVVVVVVINAARYEHITSFVDSFDLFFRSFFFLFLLLLLLHFPVLIHSAKEVMRTCLLNQLNYITKRTEYDNVTQTRVSIVCCKKSNQANVQISHINTENNSVPGQFNERTQSRWKKFTCWFCSLLFSAQFLSILLIPRSAKLWAVILMGKFSLQLPESLRQDFRLVFVRRAIRNNESFLRHLFFSLWIAQKVLALEALLVALMVMVMVVRRLQKTMKMKKNKTWAHSLQW